MQFCTNSSYQALQKVPNAFLSLAFYLKITLQQVLDEVSAALCEVTGHETAVCAKPEHK